MPKDKPQTPTTAPQSPPDPSVAWVEQEAALKRVGATAADLKLFRRHFLKGLGGELSVGVITNELPAGTRGIYLTPAEVEELGNPTTLTRRIVQGRDGTRRLVIG